LLERFNHGDGKQIPYKSGVTAFGQGKVQILTLGELAATLAASLN